MATRKKRRNADDDLRKLERKAFETSDATDIEAYWRACIRAKIHPKPNLVKKSLLGSHLVGGVMVNNLVDTYYWTLYPNLLDGPNSVYAKGQGTRSPDFKEGGKGVFFPKYIKQYDGYMPVLEGFGGANSQLYGNPLLDLLAIVLDQDKNERLVAEGAHGLKILKNPRKKRYNADDALRKAERNFENDPTEENKGIYWRLLLKAGRIPEPTWVINDGIRFVRKWQYKTKHLDVAIYDDSQADSWERSPHNVYFYLIDDVAKGFLKEQRSNWSRIRDEGVNTYIKEFLEELLNMENPRKKRRNADDVIRSLERAAAQTKAPDDILAYWTACLRAGVFPSPTTKMRISSELEFIHWKIGINIRKLPCITLIIDSRRGAVESKRWLYHKDCEQAGYQIQENQVVDKLKQIIKYWEAREKKRLARLARKHARKQNPRKRRIARNADDNLRKLERASLSGNEQDLIAYWTAALRAGEIPKPNNIEGNGVICWDLPYGKWAQNGFAQSWVQVMPSKNQIAHNFGGATRWSFWHVCEFQEELEKEIKRRLKEIIAHHEKD